MFNHGDAQRTGIATPLRQTPPELHKYSLMSFGSDFLKEMKKKKITRAAVTSNKNAHRDV